MASDKGAHRPDTRLPRPQSGNSAQPVHNPSSVAPRSKATKDLEVHPSMSRSVRSTPSCALHPRAAKGTG
eukprot:14053354-Alexandrium_andersonii.AAC.1